MNNSINYNWYPGHMTKARRMMEENVKLVDLVIEIVDARCIQSSENPDIDKLAKNKARLLLLNKADLADPNKTNAWVAEFKKRGIEAIPLTAKNKVKKKDIDAAVECACAEIIARNKARGISGKKIRAMIAGIPNVGKSTFINSYVRRTATKTGNKPGVTKGKQWITFGDKIELLDTPGILWPRFDNQITGQHLAFIGSMNDQVINIEELAFDLIGFLMKFYPGTFEKRYEVKESYTEEELTDDYGQEIKPALAVMQAIAKKRGCMRRGGDYDYDKVSKLILEDFRSGRLGRISLEIPKAAIDRFEIEEK